MSYICMYIGTMYALQHFSGEVTRVRYCARDFFFFLFFLRRNDAGVPTWLRFTDNLSCHDLHVNVLI